MDSIGQILPASGDHLMDAPFVDEKSQTSGYKQGLLTYANQPGSAADSLVITARTRYPSDAIRASATESLYIVAQNLLKLSEGDSKSDHRVASLHQRRSVSFQRSLSTNCVSTIPFDGLSNSQYTSRTVSGTSTSLSASSFLSAGYHSSSQSERDANCFAAMYNRAGARHGLKKLSTPLETEDMDKPADVAPPSKQSQPSSMTRLLHRLSRISSSRNLKETRNSHRISRKSSVGSLLSRRFSSPVKTPSLDNIYRLGGVSIMRLPSAYRTVHFAMPTCLAATAMSLIGAKQRAGYTTPGIFRVPGRATVVSALYEHYVGAQREALSVEQDQVEITVGYNSLPSNIHAEIHDVASAFKRFLWDLPGGILGSLALFEALKDIEELQDAGIVKAKLIALAVLSIRSSRRMVLISAVFGLLAFLKQDSDSVRVDQAILQRSADPESMSSKAFGLIFAPLLLGDQASRIRVPKRESTAESYYAYIKPGKAQSVYKHAPRSLQVDDQTAELEATKARNHSCASVAELMITSWDEILRQITLFEMAADTPHTLSNSLRTPCVAEENVREESVREESVHEESVRDWRSDPPSGLSSTEEVGKHTLNHIDVKQYDLFNDLHQPRTPSLEIEQLAKPDDFIFDSPVHESEAEADNSEPSRSLHRSPPSGTGHRLSQQVFLLPKRHEDSAQALPVNVFDDPAWWERAQSCKSCRPSEKSISSQRFRHEMLSGGPPTSGAQPYDSFSAQYLRPDAVPSFPAPPDQISTRSTSHLRDHRQLSVSDQIERSQQKHFRSSPEPVAADTEAYFDPRSIVAPTSNGLISLSSPIRSLRGLIDEAPSLGLETSSLRELKQSFRWRESSFRRIWRRQEQRDFSQFTRSSIPRPFRTSAQRGIRPSPSIHLPIERAAGAEGTAVPERATTEWLVHMCNTTDVHMHQQPSDIMVNNPQSLTPASVLHRSGNSPSSRQAHGMIGRPHKLARGVHLYKELPDEPTVACRVESDIDTLWPRHEQWPRKEDLRNKAQKLRVSTLYDEITHLKGRLWAKTEETAKLRSQLEAMGRPKTCGTLAEQLRDMQRQMKTWRMRAQWAESANQGKTIVDRNSVPALKRSKADVVDDSD